MRDSGLSPEADEALAVLDMLCGPEFVRIVEEDVNWIEVAVQTYDDHGVYHYRITIGIDGRVTLASP